MVIRGVEFENPVDEPTHRVRVRKFFRIHEKSLRGLLYGTGKGIQNFIHTILRGRHF